jgi:membrane protease YdiL (CAAX protease family)
MPGDFITYTLMLSSYLIYFIAVRKGAKSGSGQLADVLSGKGELDILLFRMIAAIFILGAGATILFESKELDLKLIEFDFSWGYVVWIFTAAAIILGISSAFRKSGNSHLVHSLPLHLSLSFILIRTLFLIVYEFFFRGTMLVVMTDDMGSVIAIILNLVFYLFVHWFDKLERYGSLVMGIVLCGVTLYYYSIWPAVIIHLSLALGHEITLLVKNKSLINKSWS